MKKLAEYESLVLLDELAELVHQIAYKANLERLAEEVTEFQGKLYVQMSKYGGS